MKVFAHTIVFALLHIHSGQCGQLRNHMHQATDHEQFSSRSEGDLVGQQQSLIKSETALFTGAGDGVPPELEQEASRKRDVSFQQIAHEDPPHKGMLSLLQAHPDEGKEGGAVSGGTWVSRIAVQFLFGVIYYFLIVAKYPKLDGLQPTPEAIKLQSENEVSATLEASFPNCFFSWCCSGPRAAHTFHSTGVLDFWPGCVAMSLCPCCTLWLVNSFTDLNAKLGGVRQNIFMGLVCACCCSCCLISQDAESLDMITGAKTKLCGVDPMVPDVDMHERLKTKEATPRLV